MTEHKPPKIALIGAGGMSFAPVMVNDIVHTPALKGTVLSLMDIREDRLDRAVKVAERMDREMDGHFSSIEAHTNLEDSVLDADFAMISAEVGRWRSWDRDFNIPRRYGSQQILGENGGPGGVIHALRTASLVGNTCKRIEKVNKDVFVINFTNPMGPVTLSVNKGSKLKNIGLCHEFAGGILFLALALWTKAKYIAAKASGTNHFTWFHEIKDKRTGEDLYPKAKAHFEKYPFLHQPLGGECLKRYGMICTTTDDHMGEYLDFATQYAKPATRARRFYKFDAWARENLTARYASGKRVIHASKLGKSHEEAVPIVEAMVAGNNRRFNAVNVPNKGYIPNLPDGMIVEVGFNVVDGEIVPDVVPPMQEDLAKIMAGAGRNTGQNGRRGSRGRPRPGFRGPLDGPQFA